jgi:hypothetical protein
MKHILRTTGVAACGLVTSLLTALIVALVERLTGHDLFTLAVWFVVPVGAIGTGMAAASGYYFGSLYFHTRPSVLLLLQMVIVAGFTQFMIYYLEYATLILDDGRRVSTLIPFTQYFTTSITSAHYRVGRALQSDAGEIGQVGYGLAVLQFVGFLLGGLGVFGILSSHPVCEGCKQYLRVLAKVDKVFVDTNDLAAYHDSLFELPLESEQFAELAARKHTAKTAEGASRLRMTLYGCPTCKGQTLDKEVGVWRSQAWKTVNPLRGTFTVPRGSKLIEAFRSKV